MQSVNNEIFQGNVDRHKRGRFRKRTVGPKLEIIDCKNNKIIKKNDLTKFVSDSLLKIFFFSGLSMHHLHLAFKRIGFDGI